MSEVTTLLVHPDDVGDLANFKAQAAAQGASVVVSSAVPRGQQFLCNGGAAPDFPTG